MTKPGSRWPVLPLLLTLLAAAWLVLADAPALQLLRHLQFDQFQRWRPRQGLGSPVRVVDIDEASLQRLGQWPWTRTQLAVLLERLQTAGARVVAFDMVFAEPDRTAPLRLAQQWPLTPAQRSALRGLPDPDAVFARSLQHSTAVLGFALLPAGQASTAQPAPPAARLAERGPSQRQWLPQAAAALAPLAQLQQAASGQGALGFVPDLDGVVRRVPLLVRVGDAVLPSLLTETLRLLLGQSVLVLQAAGRSNGLAGVQLGALTLPTTAEGELWLHYRAAPGLPPLPAWQVLEGALAPGSLAGAVVLVGTSAQGLMDLRHGPLGPLPGVQVHAQALEQVLAGDFLQRPAWARGLEALLLLLGCTVLGVLVLRRQALVAAVGGMLLLLALAGLAWWAFVRQGLLIDATAPAGAWLLCYLACSLWQHRRREQDQAWLRQAFARYVSPNRVAWLLAHPQTMALGGRRQECSFVFTDLAGFTRLMEELDAQQAVALLNGYLDAMVAIAFRFEGTLDRIVGDGMAVLFSAPLEQADHRTRALACALEMDAFACRYADRQHQQGIAWGQTRIGVHAGEVIVGNFGGPTLFDYRALGDPVNAAARLEAANRHLGTRVCVSQAIVAANPQVAVRPVGQLLLAGKQQPLAAFEPLGPADDAPPTGPHAGPAGTRAPLQQYLQAYAAMEQQQAQALALFERLAAAWPKDGLVALHCARLRAGMKGVQMTVPR